MLIEKEQTTYMECYFNGNVPKSFIDFSPAERRKTTIAKEDRPQEDKKYFSDKEYEKLVVNYIVNSNKVIEYRANKIIEQLKFELSNEEES